MAFLPANYDVPESAGNYLKFTEGTHKFRILSSPVLGWEVWEDKGDKRVVTRYPYDAEHPGTAKHFWVMTVYNYTVGKIQILSINQKGMQQDIKALAMNEDWGTPLSYDITVVRTGKGLSDTKYTVTPSPKKPLSDEAKEAFTNTKVDLDKWMKGEEPFEASPEQVKAKAAEEFPDHVDEDMDEDLPFGEI